MVMSILLNIYLQNVIVIQLLLYYIMNLFSDSKSTKKSFSEESFPFVIYHLIIIILIKIIIINIFLNFFLIFFPKVFIYLAKKYAKRIPINIITIIIYRRLFGVILPFVTYSKLSSPPVMKLS